MGGGCFQHFPQDGKELPSEPGQRLGRELHLLLAGVLRLGLPDREPGGGREQRSRHRQQHQGSGKQTCSFNDSSGPFGFKTHTHTHTQTQTYTHRFKQLNTHTHYWSWRHCPHAKGLKKHVIRRLKTRKCTINSKIFVWSNHMGMNDVDVLSLFTTYTQVSRPYVEPASIYDCFLINQTESSGHVIIYVSHSYCDIYMLFPPLYRKPLLRSRRRRKIQACMWFCFIFLVY